jgi:AbiV family abortive infection protein
VSQELEDHIPEEVENLSRASLSHARDLLRGAHRLRDESLPHLAFHLATLALEEIGKAELLVVGYLAGRREDAWPGKHANDHVKKLFWAIWGPTLGKELPTKHQIESLQGLARGLHETRMRGMYAATESDDFYVPKQVVAAEELEQLLELVESRLGMEEGRTHAPLTEEGKKDYLFFMNATEDVEKRRLIFGRSSMEQLVELGRPRAWIRWLREQFEEADAMSRAAAERELKRLEPDETEADEPKWKLTIRIFSDSHSIRPETLNAFNERFSWLKLYPVDKKKDQLLLELTFPRRVSIHTLWWVGLVAARSFVTALNVGSMGYFWWYLPEQVSHYYEKLIDLESNSKLEIGRSPALRIGWPKNALTEDDLARTLLCFSMMPRPDKREDHPPFDHYATGLALMSKSDIHLQFEPQAFGEFYESLKCGTRVLRRLGRIPGLRDGVSERRGRNRS